MALPMPLDAPVTSATLPSSRISMERGTRSAGTVRGAVNRLADESVARTSASTRTTRSTGTRGAPEAFAEARAEDKPVLLSVGYSACHWCHVMAHESFEDDEVAAVDERPVREHQGRPRGAARRRRRLHGRRPGHQRPRRLADDGVPDARRPPVLRRHLLPEADASCSCWRPSTRRGTSRRAELLEPGRPAHRGARSHGHARAGRRRCRASSTSTSALGAPRRSSSTAEWGGFGGAPEVPPVDEPRAAAPGASPPTRAGDALAVVTTSLDAMAAGGIYDHLGGGFARYSVDREWLVPHFEKMLYDQALLIPVYLHAWQVTGEAALPPGGRRDRRRTCCRDLGQPGGRVLVGRGRRLARARRPQRRGPVLHLDAGRDRRRARRRGLTRRRSTGTASPRTGNFEGRTILRRPLGAELLRPPDVEDGPPAPLRGRGQPRPRPGLDDKVLTEWNALMVAALAEAGAATGTPAWIDAARRGGRVPARPSCARADGRWQRSWQARRRRPPRRARRRPRRPRPRLRRRWPQATGEARWIDRGAW